MMWSTRAVLAAALLVVCSVPALAQVGGHPVEISAGAGMVHFDTRARIQDGASFGGGLGLRVTPWVSFEATGLFAPSKSELNTSVNHTFLLASGDLRWNLRPAENRVVPFFLTGLGYGMSHSDARSPTKNDEPAGSLGLGLLYNVGGPRTYVRLQVRDAMLHDRTTEVVNHFAVTAGIHYVLGGKFKDQDLDGVRDWIDRCPDTPIGAKVDAHGCPTDADGDSVFDGLDKCPDTPHGCKVDGNGCPTDSDGDGVCDGLDQCANTPKGATVDAKGCPSDADGDGVPDGIDACPNTPKGAVVDEKGCPKDSDGDGVPDGIDKCADTPKGVAVDAEGCPTEAGRRETELMDTGRIRMQVSFEPDKADILDTSKPALDAVGTLLTGWPTVKFEIAVHTDNQGAAKANLKLSQDRAKGVLDYLLQKSPTLNKDLLVPRGYGGSRPIADNGSEPGRALNRRVEFVVLDKAAFKREIEIRMGKAPRPTPSDSSSAPPDTTR